MRPVTFVVLGAIAYATFLAATLPATVVAPRVEAASGGRVSLSGVSGTIVEGAGSVNIRAATLGMLRVEEVRWRWRPALLLAGRLAFDVEARSGGLRLAAQAARTPGEWQVRDLRGEGDASALGEFVPLAAAWQPAGAITIDSPLVAFDAAGPRGHATLEWRDATLSLSTARPLGSWRAELAAEGGPAKLTLATTKGPLRLSGNGTLAMPGSFAFRGEARAEPGREKDLEAVLRLLGPRRADGAHAIEMR